MTTSTNNHQSADTPKKRVLILGGGYAGVMAARRLAHHTRSNREAVEITLVNGSDQFVERIRLHQTAVAQKIRHFTVPQLLEGSQVRFVHGWVTNIDPVAQTVTVNDQANVRVLHYDYMIYALGSAINFSNVPGAAENSLSVTDYQHAVELQERLVSLSKTSGQNSRVLIVGGGLTGIEMATEVAEQYPQLRVSLMTQEPFAEVYSPRGNRYIHQVFEDLKIHVVDHAQVTHVNPNSVDYISISDGGSKQMAADVIIWTASFAVPTLARESGLSVNGRGQVVVDSHLRSVSYSNIYAAGDSSSPSEAIDQLVDMGCKTALPMGSYAADDLAARLNGRTWKAFDFGYVIYCISLGRRAGLVQFYKPNGQPRNSALIGWLGAKVKELICQFTVWQMKNEGMFFYTTRPKAYRTDSQSIKTPLPGGAQ
jgi:NADH dehydrogenase